MQFVSVFENMSTLNKNLAIIRHDRGSGRENVEKLKEWKREERKKENQRVCFLLPLLLGT